MSDVYIDPDTGDIWVGEGGQTRLTETVEEDAAQRLKIKLRWFIGDYFLGTNLGLPFFQQILVKQPNMATLRSIFNKAITEDAAVQKLDYLTLEVIDRTLAVRFGAILIDGTLLELSLGINVAIASGRLIVVDHPGGTSGNLSVQPV